MKYSKKLGVVALIATVLASSLTMGVSLVAAKNVKITVDGEVQEIVTYSKTVDEFVKSQKISVGKGDVVKPALKTEITSDMEVEILKAKEYNVIEIDSRKKIKAAGETVAEVLENAGIELNENDYTEPSLYDEPTGQTIELHRIVVKNSEKEYDIKFNTEEVLNDSLSEGEVKIVQAGVNGMKRDVVQNIYENKELVSSIVISSKVIDEPIDQIQEVGAKKDNTISGKKYSKVIVMQGTAYDPTAGSKTAMGTRARVGAVAVDPRVIPLGSKLYIESMDSFPTYGFAVAEDTGGAIKGNRIDLFYNSNAQARRFGRRNVKVYVLED